MRGKSKEEDGRVVARKQRDEGMRGSLITPPNSRDLVASVCQKKLQLQGNKSTVRPDRMS